MHETDHARRCYERWGHTDYEYCLRVHEWVDAPYHSIVSPIHRLWRHDPYSTPLEAMRLFGHPAEQCVIGHILDDHASTQGMLGAAFTAAAPLFLLAVAATASQDARRRA